MNSTTMYNGMIPPTDLPGYLAWFKSVQWNLPTDELTFNLDPDRWFETRRILLALRDDDNHVFPQGVSGDLGYSTDDPIWPSVQALKDLLDCLHMGPFHPWSDYRDACAVDIKAVSDAIIGYGGTPSVGVDTPLPAVGNPTEMPTQQVSSGAWVIPIGLLALVGIHMATRAGQK